MMTPEQAAAHVNAQRLLFEIRLESMRARDRTGGPLYTEQDYSAVEREADSVIGHNAVTVLFRDANF